MPNFSSVLEQHYVLVILLKTSLANKSNIFFRGKNWKIVRGSLGGGGRNQICRLFLTGEK